MEYIKNDYNTLPQQVEENTINIDTIMSKSPYLGFSELAPTASVVIPNNTSVYIMSPQQSGSNVRIGVSFDTTLQYANVVMMDNGAIMSQFISYYNNSMQYQRFTNISPSDVNRTITNNSNSVVYYRYY